MKSLLYIWFMFIPTKEQVIQSYLIEKKTTRQCAEIFEMSQPWFRKYMQYYGISARTKQEYPGSNTGKKFSEEHKRKISSAIIDYYDNLDDKSRPNRKTGKIVKCSSCGKEIWRKKVHLKDKFNFCSPKCHGEWKSKNLIGESNPHYNRVIKNCGYCGKEILCRSSRLRRLKMENVFCSSGCHDLWRKENVRGGMLYNWKGGYDPYYGENWLTQRRLAWERDKYECKRCGKTKEETKRNPDVHHIKPFREFGVENYKEANDLGNLVCLCNKCHKIVEENENDFFNLKLIQYNGIKIFVCSRV